MITFTMLCLSTLHLGSNETPQCLPLDRTAFPLKMRIVKGLDDHVRNCGTKQMVQLVYYLIRYWCVVRSCLHADSFISLQVTRKSGPTSCTYLSDLSAYNMSSCSWSIEEDAARSLSITGDIRFYPLKSGGLADVDSNDPNHHSSGLQASSAGHPSRCLEPWYPKR